MIDLTTDKPGTGGGGNAGSSFSDLYFNIFNDIDPTKKIEFDASTLNTNTVFVLGLPTTFGGGAGTLILSQPDNAFHGQCTFFADTGAGTSKVPTIVLNAGTSHISFLYMSDATGDLVLQYPSAGLTNSRFQTVADANGMFSMAGNGADPPAAGYMGRVNRTNQSADIASTKLTNLCPAGQYLVNWVLEDTAADVTAGAITLTIGWTDDAGATTKASSTLVLSATGRTSDPPLVVYLASGDITYSVAHTGIFGTARYALRMRVVALG